MPDIELKRGYEVLPDNNVRFGIRVINNSNFAISDVEVILDYSESLFEIEGDKIQKLGTIPPTVPRTAKFILKPLGCVHKEEMSATVLYKDHQWNKHVGQMRPKEVHCVCPFLKEKSVTRADFLRLSNTGYLEERGVNFEGITVEKLVEFLSYTCRNKLYKVDEFVIEKGKILYLAGDALGEKAYYLLTAVVKEYEGLTQVLLRASSDKSHGLNGFLNEILDNLRDSVSTANAKEIGIIKKVQAINIIDSVVQRSHISIDDGMHAVTTQESMRQGVDHRVPEETPKKSENKRATIGALAGAMIMVILGLSPLIIQGGNYNDHGTLRWDVFWLIVMIVLLSLLGLIIGSIIGVYRRKAVSFITVSALAGALFWMYKGWGGLILDSFIGGILGAIVFVFFIEIKRWISRFYV